MHEKLGRLAAANIQLLPLVEITTHFVFERHGFISLVERRGESFGGIGAAGLLTDKGLAPLIWRDGQAFFVARDFEQAATPEEIGQLRSFSADLKSALA